MRLVSVAGLGGGELVYQEGWLGRIKGRQAVGLC